LRARRNVIVDRSFTLLLAQLCQCLVPVLFVTPGRTALLLPKEISRPGNVLIRRRGYPYSLVHQQGVEPTAVLRAQRDGRLAEVVNPTGEAALGVAAGERSLQVEDGVPVVVGQGQAEAGQALLQGSRINLVALRLR